MAECSSFTSQNFKRWGLSSKCWRQGTGATREIDVCSPKEMWIPLMQRSLGLQIRNTVASDKQAKGNKIEHDTKQEETN